MPWLPFAVLNDVMGKKVRRLCAHCALSASNGISIRSPSPLKIPPASPTFGTPLPAKFLKTASGTTLQASNGNSSRVIFVISSNQQQFLTLFFTTHSHQKQTPHFGPRRSFRVFLVTACQ